jgi:hypothetical protein
MLIGRLMEKRRSRRRAGRAGEEMARTLAAASQMALLCPAEMDVWIRRELTGCCRPEDLRPGTERR